MARMPESQVELQFGTTCGEFGRTFLSIISCFGLFLSTTLICFCNFSYGQTVGTTLNAPSPVQNRDSNVGTQGKGIPKLSPLIAPGDPILTPSKSVEDKLNETEIELVDFREQDLGQAMRLFSEQTGINVVPSTKANKKKINLFLKNVKPISVLENLTKTHDLFFRQDEKSGVIRIYTVEEYEENLASFREEQTKVFTLLYPNPVDAAMAIRDLFGNRVQLNFSVGDQDSVLDIIYRLNRFDLVDSRSLGLGQFQGNYNYGGRRVNSVNGNNSLGGRQSGRPSDETRRLTDLSADQIQQLIDAINQRQTPREQSGDPKDPISKLLKERQATIYVTVVRRNNQVIVRTGDEATMEQIGGLIQKLDVPTPLVLLEVKVMSVILADGFRSAFDYQFSDGSTTGGGFTTGDIIPPAADQLIGNAKKFGSLVPGGSVLNQGDFTFQVVNDVFRARMQLLEDDNRVTVLNTPLLLTANNEVSRIFIGDTIPFTVGFNSPQVVTGGNNNTTIAGTPITELRDVGQSLLITPSINADRTVTLRIVQENARRVLGGGTIPVLNTNGVITNQAVDTVNRSTVSGTIVAKDGMAVVLGGLIEDEVNDDREQVPGLGKLPFLGFFFRRQETNRVRRELVVMVRPYVFNTPAESALQSQDLLQQLSVHPSAVSGEYVMPTFAPHEAVQADLDSCKLHKAFRFHNVVPRAY